MFRRADADASGDGELVQAVEAVLEGRYAEFLQRRGSRVPPWAWTNLLAHGTEADLQRATHRRIRPYWDMSVWRRAQSYLAGEVLDAARYAGSLAALQHEILVPLECDLVGWIPSRYTSAGQWAARVLAALDDHRRAVSRRR